MPQMSPINWSIMFIVFLTALMVTASKLFFNKSYNSSNNDLLLNFYQSTENKWEW